MENSLDEEGIIRPHKGRNDPALGSDVIMAMIPSDLAYLAGRTGASKVTFPGSRLVPLYVKEEKETPFLALCGPFTGAPHAVMALEKLIVMGAKRVWVLGWCGSLQPDVRIGDILLPTLAISEEGTSRHYPVGNKSIQPDRDLHRMLLEYMEQEQIPFSAGDCVDNGCGLSRNPSKGQGISRAGRFRGGNGDVRAVYGGPVSFGGHGRFAGRFGRAFRFKMDTGFFKSRTQERVSPGGRDSSEQNRLSKRRNRLER